MELRVDPNKPSLICIEGQRWESLNPSLSELFDVLEQTESILLARVTESKRGEGAC